MNPTPKQDDWYFLGPNNLREGPVSRASLVALHSAGSVSDSTLVWTAGMNGWQAYTDAMGEPSTLERPPDPPELPKPAPDKGPAQTLTSNSTSQVEHNGDSRHPWRRYFARLIDLCTLGLAGVMVIWILLAAVAPKFYQEILPLISNPVVANMMIVGVWVPIEAWLLGTFGSTPAKWLFRIRIRTADGQKLAPARAFERAIGVAIQGQGGGFPLVALFTTIFAYRRLMKTGVTLWDASTGAIVTCEKLGVWRAVLCWIVAATVLIGVSALNSL